MRARTTVSGYNDPALSVTPSGFLDISLEFSVGDYVYYTIIHDNGSEFEIGVGPIYDDSGTKRILRERVLSSNIGTNVNFTGGNADIILTPPVELLLPALQTPVKNSLINPGFDIFQQQAPTSATTRNDTSTLADGWYALTQSGNVSCERVTGDQSRYGMKLTQLQVSAQRFGYAQIVDHDRTCALRGGPVIFQGAVRPLTGLAYRAAILYWKGTADSPPREIVNSWTSTTYTPNNFFVSSSGNITVGDVSVIDLPSDDVLTPFEIRANVPSDANNIYVFVWVSQTASQNYTLIAEMHGLFNGTERKIWMPRPYDEEVEACRVRWEKNLPPDTVAADGTAGIARCPGIAWSSSNLAVYIPFLTMKRSTPSVTLFRNSAIATAGRWGYINNSGSWTALPVPTIYPDRFGFLMEFTGTFTAGRSYVTNGTFIANSEP